MAKQERFEIIAGERRYRAHCVLDRESIECKVFEGLSRAQTKAASLIENLQREGLNPIEEAEGFRDLMATEGLTQEQCAQRVGKSRPVVANALRVLELPAKIVGFIRGGELTMAHAVALARFKAWPPVAEKIAELAVKHKAPAGDLEKGLPYGEELAEAKLAVDLGHSGHFYSRRDLPAKEQKDVSIIEGKSDEYYARDLFCLDVSKGQALLKEAEEKVKARETERAVEKGRKPDGGMTPAALAARRKKIADNKRHRAEGTAQLEAAFLRLKGVTAIDKPALSVVVGKLLCDGHYGNQVKEAAQKLGITLPAKLLTSSWYNEIHLGKLAELSEVDMIRLAAAAVCLFHGNGAILNANPVPEEVEHIAGKAKPAPKPAAPPQKAAVVAKPAKAKAARRGVIDDQVRSEVRKLVESGRTGAAIAKALKISLPSVHRIKKSLGLIKS